MTRCKSALALAAMAALAACAPGVYAPLEDGASGADVSRAARTPAELTELDIVRTVQSSL